MRDWGFGDELSETAELLVSELVTNAVLHATGSPSCRVTCTRSASAITVTVVDQGGPPGRPERGPERHLGTRPAAGGEPRRRLGSMPPAGRQGHLLRPLRAATAGRRRPGRRPPRSGGAP
ncbi:ATP-binding protein [Streptomyces microflavus]|uniref:ATP-binding protein n=1 Tax=Streptomyces microflavus TaxID=1919 RepID=UPI0033D39F92